jgi:hypothetical protein
MAQCGEHQHDEERGEKIKYQRARFVVSLYEYYVIGRVI